MIVPVTRTRTNEQGSTIITTTRAFQTAAETSAVIDVTTTDDQGRQVTTQQTVPAAVVRTTNAQGETITTVSTMSYSFLCGLSMILVWERG